MYFGDYCISVPKQLYTFIGVIHWCIIVCLISYVLMHVYPCIYVISHILICTQD